MILPPVSAAARAIYLMAFSGVTGLSAAATRTWDGSSGNAWATGANWSNPPTAPVDDDNLIFPATGANKSMTNNISGGPSFYYVKFAGAGYTLSGNPLWVGCNLPPSGIEITHPAGTTTFASEVNTTCVTIADGATLRVTSAGSLSGGGCRLQMTVSGGASAAGAAMRLQFSDDLQSWTNLGPGSTASAGGTASFDINDPAAGSARRYSRAVIP